MALIACRECAAQVSKTAKSCPACGVGHPDEREFSKARTSSYVLGLLLAAVLIPLAFVLLDALAG